jgi:Na+-driven multidrug efflux pump
MASLDPDKLRPEVKQISFVEPSGGSALEWSEIVRSLELLPTLLKSSVPIMISLFFSISGVNLMMFMFAGTYVVDGNESSVFAGVALSTTFTNISFLSILIGMASAVETLGSQHHGSGNYVETGLTLQRSVLILTCMSVPIFVLWLYVGELFAFIGVAPEVCLVLSTFIRVSTCLLYIFVLDFVCGGMVLWCWCV